jgi:predicted porin
MKKHLIAAAVAAAVVAPAAMAQNVTIYGVIDQGYTATESKGTLGNVSAKNKTTTTGDGGAFTTQRLGFRGSEDLGGGMKAFFTFEQGIADNDGVADSGAGAATQLTTRLAFVGLEGGFGKLQLGRMNTQAENAWGVGDVGGGNNFIGRAYSATFISVPGATGGLFLTEAPAATAPESYAIRQSNSRSDRLVEYTTPSIGGFTAAVQYGKRDQDSTTVGLVTQETSGTETGVGLRYSAGPLNIMLGMSREKYKVAGVDGYKIDQTILGANYDFGVLRLFGNYAEGKQDSRGVASVVADATTQGVTKPKTYEIGAAIPFGAFTAQVSYFDGTVKLSDTGADAGKFDVDGFQLSGLYALSKRTTAYVVYAENEFKATGVKVENNQFGIGIRHSF